MKTIKIWMYPLILMGLVFILTNSCKKDNNTSTTIDSKYLPIIFNPYLSYGSMTDIDGNVYKTIKIGTQTWMAENLKTTRFNDSTAIPLVTVYSEWNLSTPAYCWYNNDISYKTNYGALYNFFAVKTGKLSPKGWHVPSVSEWTILTEYLGGDLIAGGKLKEIGTSHWVSPNYGAINETGFTALPGSWRVYSGEFYMIGISGFWWSSTEDHYISSAWELDMQFNSNYASKSQIGSNNGYSVRCVKN